MPGATTYLLLILFRSSTWLSHSFNFDQRRLPDKFRTAMPITFLCPTSTTNRIPRVIPV
jgi:hypothetical protein